MKKNKGFTLIELLTVIAIMGILSAVILVSLTSARLKSKDTAVKSQLSNMRVQAELYFGTNNNSYVDLCTASVTDRGFGGATGPGLLKETKDATAIPSTLNLTNNAGGFNVVTCHASSTGWAVEAPLYKSISSSPVMFCVDGKTISPKDTTSILLGSSGDTICE